MLCMHMYLGHFCQGLPTLWLVLSSKPPCCARVSHSHTQVILCKPFLRVNPGCPRQGFIKAVARRGDAVAALAGALGRAAPEGLKRRLLRAFGRECLLWHC